MKVDTRGVIRTQSNIIVWQHIFYQFSSPADEGLKEISGKKVYNKIENNILVNNSSWYFVGRMSRYMFHVTCLYLIPPCSTSYFFYGFNFQNILYENVVLHWFWFYFDWVGLFYFTFKWIEFK